MPINRNVNQNIPTFFELLTSPCIWFYEPNINLNTFYLFFGKSTVFFPAAQRQIIHKFAPMDNSFFEKLFSDWSKVYFTEPVACIISLIAIILGIKNYRKDNIYNLFILYVISCFILLSFVDIVRIALHLPAKNRSIFTETGNTLFELTELFVFYYFFLTIIKSNFVQLIMKLCFVVFLVFVFLFFIKITDQSITKTEVVRLSTLIGSIKFFMMLIPIFTYFFELVGSDPTKYILYSHSLWITSGLFLYCLATLPFLLISDSLVKSNRSLYLLMFSIHFLSLSFLLLTIIKAFTCRRPLIT